MKTYFNGMELPKELSRTEKRNLLSHLDEGNNRNVLIERCIGYVFEALDKYILSDRDLNQELIDELTSVGYTALVEAIKRYDISYAQEFRTYVFQHIKRRMIFALEKDILRCEHSSISLDDINQYDDEEFYFDDLIETLDRGIEYTNLKVDVVNAVKDVHHKRREDVYLLFLSCVDGYPIEELAEANSVSQSRIFERIQKGRRAMGHRLVFLVKEV